MKFTPEEIAAMAKEAGARSEHWATRLFPAVQFLFTPDDLSRFAALVAEKAWEGGAQVCYQKAKECMDIGRFDAWGVAEELAESIRALGQKEGA